MSILTYLDLCKSEIKKLETHKEHLIQALEAVEYVVGENSKVYCPWCGYAKESGHANDCERQKVLEE